MIPLTIPHALLGSLMRVPPGTVEGMKELLKTQLVTLAQFVLGV